MVHWCVFLFFHASKSRVHKVMKMTKKKKKTENVGIDSETTIATTAHAVPVVMGHRTSHIIAIAL